jgi:hypothetical protein
MGAQEVIELLEEELLPFTPDNVRAVTEGRRLGAGDLEVLAQKVVAEGTRRSLEVLERFFEALEVRPSLLPIEKHLLSGGKVYVWGSDPLKWGQEGKVELRNEKDLVVEEFSFSLPKEKRLDGVRLQAWAGLTILGVSTYFLAAKGRAYFKTIGLNEVAVEEVLKAGTTLRPFLPAMGVEDLDRGFYALESLGKRKSGVEGEYVLAKTARAWLLRRGLLLGDGRADRNLLAGRPVTLRFPGEVEITVEVDWLWDHMGLAHVRIRRGEEVFRAYDRWLREFRAHPLHRDPVTKTFRRGLESRLLHFDRYGRDSAFEKLSLEMLAFLRALAVHEAPFQALAEERLGPYISAEFFADL